MVLMMVFATRRMSLVSVVLLRALFGCVTDHRGEKGDKSAEFSVREAAQEHEDQARHRNSTSRVNAAKPGRARLDHVRRNAQQVASLSSSSPAQRQEFKEQQERRRQRRQHAATG